MAAHEKQQVKSDTRVSRTSHGKPPKHRGGSSSDLYSAASFKKYVKAQQVRSLGAAAPLKVYGKGKKQTAASQSEMRRMDFQRQCGKLSGPITAEQLINAYEKQQPRSFNHQIESKHKLMLHSAASSISSSTAASADHHYVDSSADERRLSKKQSSKKQLIKSAATAYTRKNPPSTGSKTT